MTSELKDFMHNRDILKIKVSKTNDPNDWALFKKQRNIVNKQIRSAKQVYYQNSFNKHTSDSRKTWQTINELTSRKSGKTSLKANELTINNPLELSNEFNNHFANIGQNVPVRYIVIVVAIKDILPLQIYGLSSNPPIQIKYFHF